MKARFAMPLFALGLFVIIIGCSSMDSDTLATIDGKEISMESFIAKNPPAAFAGKDHAFIDSKVDDFVKQTLFTQVALERGLGENADIQEKKLAAEKRQMLQYVYTKAILDAVISDEYLRELYDQSGTELNARHILLQFEGTARSRSDRSKAATMALMEQIKTRLSGGESFADLATEFTDDPSGKSSGGDLGWFGWGKMVGPFQEAAFKLNPGEVSDVVETSFGLHIIKLEAKRELERGTFDEVKNSLKQQAGKEKGQELSQKANLFLENQKQGAGFEVLPDGVHDLFLVFEKSSNKQDPMDKVLKKLNFSAPLFMLNGEGLGSSWIIEELKTIDEGQKPRFSSENQLLSILDQLVTQYLVVSYGYEQNYNQDLEFSEKINALVERYAYEAFIAQEINANLTPGEEELVAFYEKNKADKYMDKKKVQVREVFVKDSLMAVALRKRIDAGELIDNLARRYTERKATKDAGGLLPPFQEGRYGEMGKTAFSLNPGEISGPIKLGNGYSVIRLEDTIPEGAKPYEKVKGRVRTEIMGELREARTNAVFEALKKEHSLKINYSAAYSRFDAAASE